MSATLKLLPVLFPAAMALLIFVFPSPEAAMNAFRGWPPNSGPATVIETGVEFDIAHSTDPDQILTYEDFTRFGCIEKLQSATPQHLEDCSRIVASAVVQVARYEQATGVETTTAERLLLAATEVCRAAWAASPHLAIDTNNPACASSTLRLASLN